MYFKSDQEFLDWLKQSPKSVQSRVMKRVGKVPDTPEKLWRETDPKNQDYLNVRIDWLTSAGWDPAGWIALEWRRLPPILQMDLTAKFPALRKMIVDETARLGKLIEKTKH